jgi:hypothetical protein
LPHVERALSASRTGRRQCLTSGDLICTRNGTAYPAAATALRPALPTHYTTFPVASAAVEHGATAESGVMCLFPLALRARLVQLAARGGVVVSSVSTKLARLPWCTVSFRKSRSAPRISPNIASYWPPCLYPSRRVRVQRSVVASGPTSVDTRLTTNTRRVSDKSHRLGKALQHSQGHDKKRGGYAPCPASARMTPVCLNPPWRLRKGATCSHVPFASHCILALFARSR